MVVDQLNVKCISSFKAENDAPVGAYRDGPQPFPIAFEGVKPVPWNIQSLRSSGGFENRKDSVNCVYHIRLYPAPVALFVEPFQAPMLETPDH